MRDVSDLELIDLAHQAKFQLGAVEVRPSTREIIAAGGPVILEPRVMQVLVALARSRGDVVSRQDLVDSCWGGRAISEDAINRAMSGVRRIAARVGGFAVETVVRVGYRLTELETHRRDWGDAAGGLMAPPAAVEGDVAPAVTSTVQARVAVMFTDVVGYARLTQNDEAGVLAMVRVIQEHLVRLVGTHGGRVISLRGDGALVCFREAAQALDCALAFQRQIAQLGVGVAPDRAIFCRVGIHYGPAVEVDGDLLGDSVNIAARLEQTADPASILVSDELRLAASRCPPLEDLGFHQLKGIALPLRLWRVSGASPGSEAVQGAYVSRVWSEDAGDGRPRVGVLPFERPADDREQTYLAEGIAEDVIGALSRFKWLFVLSRNSSLNYRNPSADVARIRADLGLDYVVTGKFLCREGVVRLAVALTDCRVGDTIWSRRFEGAINEIFDIQDEITATIVGALDPALIRREGQDAASPKPRSLRHWDLFIRGRWHFWQLTHGHMAKASVILTQALALKPDDAPTLAMLAYTRFTRLWSGWADDPESELAEARRFAMRAVRVDGDEAMAHYAFGTALAMTGDLEPAMVEQKHALELNPNFAGAMGEMGRYLAFSGRYDEAMTYLDRAIRSSPGDPHRFLWFRDKAFAAFVVGRYDEAVAFAHESAALRPDVFLVHYPLAACWAAAGAPDKARQAFEEARRIMPRYGFETLKLGQPFARSADLERFVEALKSCGWED